MTPIAVLTPDPSDPSYAGQWPGVLERLSQALAGGGIAVRATPWTDHVEDASGLMAHPLVLAVIAWGYHRDAERWLAATRTWAAAGVPIANPASVLGWNADKLYLARLQERGVAIPPTIWSDRPDAATVADAFDGLDSDRLVIKPRISGGAWRTVVADRGGPVPDLPPGPSLIQAYLTTIETEGELSLLFFGGRFSHAVCKRPAPGEFRIQVQFGGLYEAVDPPSPALDLARRVLATVEEPLLYARIDLIRDPAGVWRLMEAELIEPDFYLSTVPEAAPRLVQAVRDRLARG